MDRAAGESSPRPWLSLVIPLYNEEESLEALHAAIQDALGDGDFEVLFVDDGSTDSSFATLKGLQQRDPRVRVLRFARNFGKAEALAVGFREARGDVVVTMDADLQDDPAEIPSLVSTLADGYDLVGGWKRHREDSLSRRLSSFVFNRVTGLLAGVHLQDVNSGFKAYRRRLVEDLDVYGELHRFLPVLAYWRGYRVTELPVVHHRRRYGRSKYGLKRVFAGALDLLTVVYLTRFQRKPLHLFGFLGLGFLSMGGAINLYLTLEWLGGNAIGGRPLLLLGVLLMLAGVQFLSVGLLGEMITRSAIEGKARGHAYDVVEPPALYPGSPHEVSAAPVPGVPLER